MKKSKVVEIFNVLTAIKAAEKDSSIKFKYAVNKNLSLIESEIKLLQDIEKENSEIAKDFYEERNNFIKEKGKADEKGNIYLPSDDADLVKEFTGKLTELSDKYKEQIEKYETLMSEYQAMLEENDATVGEVYKFSVDACPDWLSMAQVEFLMKEGFLE